jgi:hypothetical protein
MGDVKAGPSTHHLTESLRTFILEQDAQAPRGWL